MKQPSENQADLSPIQLARLLARQSKANAVAAQQQAEQQTKHCFVLLGQAAVALEFLDAWPLLEPRGCIVRCFVTPDQSKFFFRFEEESNAQKELPIAGIVTCEWSGSGPWLVWKPAKSSPSRYQEVKDLAAAVASYFGPYLDPDATDEEIELRRAAARDQAGAGRVLYDWFEEHPERRPKP